jgi:DNA-binding CsgD family transcriptional regulator
MTHLDHRLDRVSLRHPPLGNREVVQKRSEPQAPASFLALVAPHLPPALDEINVPAYVIDGNGRIRWLNEAAKALVGDAIGRLFTSVLDPDDIRRARARFIDDMHGLQHGDFAIDIVTTAGGEQCVDVSSVPLRSRHRVIGVFGLAVPRREGRNRPAKLDGRLTPRQHEILLHVADGESTDQIAAELHLSRETVRNHVRHILRRLGTNSRLEAVAVARRDEIL